MAAALAGKIVLMRWLVPSFGALGAALATTGAYALMAGFLYVRLPREYRSARARVCIYPIVKAAVAMMAVLKLYTWLMDASGGGRLWASAEALGGVVLGAAVYIACIVRGSVFSEQELSALPFVHKFHLRLGSR